MWRDGFSILKPMNTAKLKLLKDYRYFLLLYVSVALIMIASALFELQQSKKELLSLMRSQSQSTLHSLIMASENLLKSNARAQEILEDHFAIVSDMLHTFAQQGALNRSTFQKLAQKTEIDGFLQITSRGALQFRYGTFRNLSLSQIDSLIDAAFYFRSFSGDTVLWQEPITDRPGERQLFAGRFYLDGSLVLLNIRPLAGHFSLHQVSFGKLIRKLAKENPSIIYLALQDTATISAAAGATQFLEPLDRSRFLKNAFEENRFAFRLLDFDSLQIFEAVHPFFFQGEHIGLFRMGLSTHVLEGINHRIYRRLVIITIILIFIASIMLTFIFIRQRYDFLKRQFTVVETYSSAIIEHVSDAILVFNDFEGLKIFNSAAERLFGKSREQVIGQAVERLLEDHSCLNFLNANQSIRQLSCTLNGKQKVLLLSKSAFTDSNDRQNYILVIRDITEQHMMENRLKRQEQLTAIGQLAAGVAHEIRNPLNSISTIVQQLKKDFTPREDQEIYNELTAIVYNEVRRINQKINDFLRFSRPEPIRPSEFDLNEWLQEILRQYESLMAEHGITARLESEWQGKVFWDANQMRQALLNLIQNAVDAMPGSGTLTVRVEWSNDHLQLTVSDTGKGIAPEHLNKIFNLYFTTKPSGTGIGLSMVQRIVFEHDGNIEVTSEPGGGTRFILRLPIRVKA